MNILKTIKELFEIEILSTEVAKRNDDDDVINLFLKDDKGKEFFLKEIQPHSFRPELNELYAFLNSISNEHFELVLPFSQTKNFRQFVFKCEDKNFLLFPRIFFLPFDTQHYPLSLLLENLSSFHKSVASFPLTRQSHRDYESWILMGLERFEKKFNTEFDFIKLFKTFMSSSWDKLIFVKGNIHWDIHQDNLGLTPEGKLIILDFDLLQEGCHATDLLAAASLYIDWEAKFKDIPDSFFNHVSSKVLPLAEGLDNEGLKFLLIRNRLGDLSSIDSKEELQKHFHKLTF